MDKYMRMAINEAKKGINSSHGGPFGCVIVKDGIVIAKAHNTVLKDHDATCHGEVNAIRKASKRLGTHDLLGCILYTTAEPCPMCLGAILWANIDKVFYGCNIADTEEIGFRDSKFYNLTQEEKANFIKELDRKQCLKLYDSYKAIENKENY